MATTTPAPDVLEALQSVTSDQLRERLRALDAERKSISALLRSVVARERALARRVGKREEVGHA